MVSQCPECKSENVVDSETWYHGVINSFVCSGCGGLFAEAPDGTYVECRYYYEELQMGNNPYKCIKSK